MRRWTPDRRRAREAALPARTLQPAHCERRRRFDQMVVSVSSIGKLLTVRPGEHCEIGHGVDEHAFSPDIAATAEGAEEVAIGAVLGISGWICRR